MPIEIKVGPPAITLSQGRTFMVTTQSGEIQMLPRLQGRLQSFLLVEPDPGYLYSSL